MPDRNNDREPRWENPGFRPDREENENREGDRSHSRNYDRGDQRRYGRQSQEQAERMRRLRGQGPDPRDQDRGRNRGDDSGYGERPLYQGYGTQIARNEGRFGDRNENRNRNRDLDRDRGGRNQGQRGGVYDDDFDYDFERDYRNNENTGRDMNLEGPGEPGRRERDPYRNRGSYGYSGGQRQVEDESNWREEQDQARENRQREWDDRSRDRQDNYWGAREQERYYDRGAGGREDRGGESRDRGRDAWWNNTSGRPDFTSARQVGSSGRNDAWGGDQGFDDDRDYDMDPGYQYEFGTDFDFMRDTSLDEARRRQERARDQGGRGREDRGREDMGGVYRGNDFRGAGNRGRDPRGREMRGQQQGRDQGGQQSQRRETWDQPGPYSGMGPSRYQRTDERIQEEICEIFTRHGQLDARDIDIEVTSGQVTLSGNVNRKNEKYLAEDLAAHVSGVQDVENRLRVQAGDDARMRGAGREDVVMPGRIQSGMRVAGVDGKHIGTVKESRENGFILNRTEGGDTFIPFRAVKRTNGQIVLHVTGGEIDRQGWKES